MKPEPRTIDAQRVDYVLRAYAALYEKRVRRRQLFGAPLQNALLGLLWYRKALLIDSRSGRAAALEAINAVTRPVLEDASSHSAATDVAGYVWAAAYGNLPMPEPPLPQVEWVLASGSTAGAIAGLAGVAWRALFLSTTWSLFKYGERRKATVELDRRVGYLIERCPLLLASTPGSRAAPFNQTAQIAAVLAELGQRLYSQELTNLASTLVDGIAEDQALDGSVVDGGVAVSATPSAHIAQFALAATVTERQAAAEGALGFLLSERLNEETGLVRRDGEDREHDELSPWIALAFVPFPATPERLGAGRVVPGF